QRRREHARRHPQPDHEEVARSRRGSRAHAMRRERQPHRRAGDEQAEREAQRLDAHALQVRRPTSRRRLLPAHARRRIFERRRHRLNLARVRALRYLRRSAKEARMNIKTEKVKLDVGGQSMTAYLAHPDDGVARPAVIVIEEIFGVNAHIRDVTERVAREGYVAVAPDVHHRAAPEGFEYPYDADGRKKGMELIPKLTADGFGADLKATLAFLRARKDVRGDRIGCMGFCIGGHLAYLAACTSDVRATASFYGGGIAAFSPGGGAPTVGRTGTIKGKILCLFGGADPMIPES